MNSFRFRLAKVLDWYGRQAQLEGERLRVSLEHAVQTRLETERHQKDVLARQRELIESPNPRVSELAALGPFRLWAKELELALLQKSQKAEQDAERQRKVSMEAQRRLRLIEKLRERQLSEHDYEAARQLEELASETFLAGFARTLNT